MHRFNGTLALVGLNKQPVRAGDSVRIAASATEHRGCVGNIYGQNNGKGMVVICDPMNASPGGAFANAIIPLEELEPVI